MAMRGRGAGRGNPSRPPRLIINRVYEEFKPMSEWRQEDNHDILLVYLPGFQKEYLKVTTEDVNIVRVRGERLVSENKWSRFQEDYRVPENCEMRGIRAKFDGGILTITMPRKITSAPPPLLPPPTTTTTSRVAPKTEEQQFRRTKQEETTRKPEEPNAMPRKITGAPPPPPPTTATTTRVAPKTEEQPFRKTKQEETIRKPKEPKVMPRKITGAPPPPPPPPTTNNTTRVAPKTEEQPFRRTKQEEMIRKPEEPKEKKPDKPQTIRFEDITLPAPPKPTSSSAPTKQPPSKPAPQAKEAMEFTTGTSPRGGFEHDVVEKPGVGKKTDLDKGKGKEATLEEEETKKDFEGKPSSSGVSGGFWAGLEKVVAGRGMTNEDRKLLVNVGVGVLIIAALGVQVSYTIGLIGKGK